MGDGDDQVDTERADAAERPASTDRITDSVLASLDDIVRKSGATAVFVYDDALDGREIAVSDDLRDRVYFVTKTASQDASQRSQQRRYIRVTNVPFTRMGQVKIAVFLALSRGLIDRVDVIVCPSGLASSGSLDTLVVMEVGREFEMFTSPTHDQSDLPAHELPEVVERVLDIATALGAEGREGEPVGALFVIGDTERVQSMSRQMILNPLKGYTEEERNLLDVGLEETIKELATLDGAFIVRGDGVVESAGTFLKTSGQDEYPLPQGLGARHQAAAAITAVCDAIAVTVSESTGAILIFRHGKVITSVEKRRALGLNRPA